MIKRKSNIKIFISLLVFTLIFSAWLPTTFADTDLPIDDDLDIAEICEEDFENAEEVLDDEEEALPEENEEEVLNEEKETALPEESEAEETIVEDENDNTESKEKEAVKPETSETEEALIEEDNDIAEDVKLKGITPMIPLPNVKPLAAGGLEDTIEVDKTAKRIKGLCRQFEVTLDITGEPQEAPVDVVLIIDKSGSMNERAGGTIFNPLSRLHYAKEAATNFASKVLGASGIPGSRVSLVTFSGPSTVNGNGAQNQAQTVRGLTSNLTQLTNDINGITAVGGTNTEAGFLQGRNVIENSDNPNSNKVVIMFTDGLPTASNGNRYEESTNVNHIHNQRAISSGKGIYQDGVADVFTVGLLQGMTTAERNLALHILDETQNKGWYEAPTAADLDQIFDDISTQLAYAATNAKVVDKIGDNFDIVQSSLPSGVTYDSNSREISWHPGTIVDGASLTYRVVAKPEFAGGSANTNEFAELSYTDVFGTNNKQKVFPVPSVNVPTLLEVELSDAEIILGDSITLGTGTDASGENYMDIFGGDGDGTYTYEWRVKGSNTIISTDRNPSVTPTEDTAYEVTVIDSNGCIATAEMTVTVRKLNVTIKKIIDGNYADFDDRFDFVVTIGDDTFTFTLGHEETELIGNIARNSTIELTEASEDYEISVKVGDQEILGEDGIYTFDLGNEDILIEVTNYREADIETGILLDNMPYVMILSSTFLGFGIYVSIRRKRKF